jgi:uncharacterized protein YjbJ (UPF0337 family)
MNQDEFEGKWKQMRGQAKEWWGKLTDDDLDRVGGKYDQFVGLIQEKYGYTRERVEKEFAGRLAKYEANQKKDGGSTPTQDVLEGKWKQIRGQARAWWGKLTDDDLDKAAGKSEKIIGLLQEKYGYSRAHAEAELNNRMAEYEKSAVPTS